MARELKWRIAGLHTGLDAAEKASEEGRAAAGRAADAAAKERSRLETDLPGKRSIAENKRQSWARAVSDVRRSEGSQLMQDALAKEARSAACKLVL